MKMADKIRCSGEYFGHCLADAFTHVMNTSPMLADTPLVKNPDNNAYMKILLDGKANLEELFADLELTDTARFEDPPIGVDRLLPGFRRLIMQQTLHGQVAQLLSKNEIMAESN